ncbi:MAG TPA: anti-sigma factor domain-containing protein [Erysipelotrichaceae bacterium]|nr:anti-sigma factor domain-containing protein [Erysipelotrichaceae bacterium]HQB32045.1 anti-sigma factor domain-containing protein [Erysipelotrichaceae bacterium]
MKKYIVMECHLSYAVVLDEDGHFLKVANRNYEVGQTVTDVIEMQIPQSLPKEKKTRKWVFSLAAVAASIIMAVTILFQMGQMTFASIYLKINPEVRIDVNRNDVVVGLSGINIDGNELIEGYDYKKKDLNLVIDELLEMAMEKGYLYDGSNITLFLDADSNEWITSHKINLGKHLGEYLKEKITVTIKIISKKQIIIPIDPDDSDYGDSDYDDSDYDDSDYDDSDYGDDNYDDSDYDDSDYDSDSGANDYGD